MLIKPFSPIKEKEFIRFNNGYKLHKDGSLSRRRIATCTGRDFARVEEIKIIPKMSMIVKTCTYGLFNTPNYIDTISWMGSSIDMESGEIIDYGAYSPIPNTSNYHTTQLLGDYMPKTTIKINDSDSIYVTNFINSEDNLSNYELLNYKIFGMEDYLQMNYNDLIGVLDSFFSQWGFNYPFDSFVVIDTYSKTFTPKFKYLKGVLDESTALKLFGLYAKSISKLVDLISYHSEMSKRKFRIKVFTNAFMSVIRITDLEHKGINITLTPSASDHFQTIINNCIAEKHFDLSENAECLMGSNTKEISLDMINSVGYLNYLNLF